MDQQTALRRETLRLHNGQAGPLLLCLEPLGEQVEMMPGQTYEVTTAGGDEGSMEVIFESSKVIVYGWNNSDSAVFHDGRRVAGVNLDQASS